MWLRKLLMVVAGGLVGSAIAAVPVNAPELARMRPAEPPARTAHAYGPGAQCHLGELQPKSVARTMSPNCYLALHRDLISPGAEAPADRVCTAPTR